MEADDSTPPVDGKVLRLHFACHAELPFGSFLRVTSSESWASTSVNHQKNNYYNQHQHKFQQQRNNINTDDDLDDTQNSSLYASSVEMVTSPEMYPLWKTRNPVIRVVNNATSSVNLAEGLDGEDMEFDAGGEDGNNGGVFFNHKYRYLVVTPGNPPEEEENGYGSTGSGMVTSDEQGGVVEVDMWEDPFIDSTGTSTEENHKPVRSTDDLPYRTVQIDVSSVNSSTFGKVLSSDSSMGSNEGVAFTSDGVRIDKWNDKSDVAFLPYMEAVEKENKNGKIVKHNGAWTSESDSDAFLSSDNNRDDNKMDTAEIENKMTSSSSPLPPKRIFLVCYHLPIILNRDPETGALTATFSESLIAKTEQSGVSKSYITHWIGTVSSKFQTDEEKDEVRNVLKPLNCTPLFLDKSLRDLFYYGMCKQVLWPAFHNIDLLDISKSGWGNSMIADAPDASKWDQSRLDGWWNAYCEVNKAFSDTLMTLVKPHDKVWVHDYHLSLLPKMIHEAEIELFNERTIQMVYFLHIPFPTSQVFREIEYGGNILEGMLHADVVGFHAFDHARHFLNASKRILGLSHESLVGGLIGVRFRGKKVLVTINNVSIETDVVQASMTLPSVVNGANELKEKYNGRQIICGVDIAQGLSGISLKLLAYERLLSDYPNWVGSVVMVQRNLIPAVRESDEGDTLNHVRHLVRRLEKSFGPDVIDYKEIRGSSLPREQRLILWTSSDVFMATGIREGLNLLPLEYVYANKAPAPPGVTMISEFSAMSSILNGALRVNPYDVKFVSTTIDKALSMSLEEKLSRRERDIHFVSTSPSGQWTRNVLRDLNDVKLATAIDDKASKSSIRASAKLKSVQSETIINSARLDSNSVTTAYNLAQKRVLFLDFNGTIVMKEPPGKYLKREMLGISANKPPQETIEALTTLCADERNIVFVVSGDSESNIEKAVGDIPGLGLAAGNGGTISRPLKLGETSRKWEAIDLGVDWKTVCDIAMPVLSKYTARANGSFVKKTSSSIGWSYYGCDPEWGEWLATYLVIELEDILHTFDIRLVKLKGVVEIVPRKLNKGKIVRRVLGDDDADFILCVGDDVSDEKMFTSVFSFLAKSETQESASHVFTVTVGKKASNASYYVENAEEIANLLVDMTNLRRSIDHGRTMSWDKDDNIPNLFA